MIKVSKLQMEFLERVIVELRKSEFFLRKENSKELDDRIIGWKEEKRLDHEVDCCIGSLYHVIKIPIVKLMEENKVLREENARIRLLHKLDPRD